MLEDPPLVLAVVPLAQFGIGQHLEAALAVELGGDRGDDAVLPEEAAHRLGIHPLGGELHQVQHRVVAIDQVHLHVPPMDLFALHAQLAGIGVQHPDAVAVGVVLDQPALLVDPLQLVLGLHQADGAAGAADRLEMLDQLLQQQHPGIDQPREPKSRILRDQQRDDDAVDHFFDRGDQVQPAHAGQVGLHEPQRVLPDRTGVVDHAVQPVEHRIPGLHRGRPAGAEPLVLRRLEPEEVVDPLVGEVELRHPEQRVVQRPGHRVEIDQLLGEEGDGAGQHPDRLHPAVGEVVHVPFDRALAHPHVRRRQLRGGQMVERLPHPRRQPRAAQARGLGGTQLGQGRGIGHGSLWVGDVAINRADEGSVQDAQSPPALTGSQAEPALWHRRPPRDIMGKEESGPDPPPQITATQQFQVALSHVEVSPCRSSTHSRPVSR